MVFYFHLASFLSLLAWSQTWYSLLILLSWLAKTTCKERFCYSPEGGGGISEAVMQVPVSYNNWQLAISTNSYLTGCSHQKRPEWPRRPDAIHFQCILAKRSNWRREQRDASVATKVDRCSTLCKWAAAQPWRKPTGGWSGFRKRKKAELPAAWKTRPAVTATQVTAATRCERPERP